MAKAVTPTSVATRRHRRPVFAIAALAVFLAAAPSPTLPGLAPPPAPRPEAGGHDALHDILAGLAGRDVRPEQESHSLREAVAAFSVRLAVDKNARHPLSGPVAVRRAPRLDALVHPLRRIALASPRPAAPAPETREAPQAPAPAAARSVQASTAPPRSASAGPTPPAPAPVVTTAAVKTLPPDRTPAPRRHPAPATAAVSGHNVLVAGDSLSLFLADALRPVVSGLPDTTFHSKGKISSGLARPDFFNWEREMARLAAESRPDTVVIMIATNDNQTMTRPDGRKVAFGRPGWETEYRRRVRRLVELARAGNPTARIFWVGAPVMGRPQLNADVAVINGIIARQIAALPDCHFVDVWRTLADGAGRYVAAVPTPSGPRTARTRDGVHLTPFGARLLANATLSAMSPKLAALERP